ANVALDSQEEFFNEPKATFAYDSSAWIKSDPTVCYLTEQHRQDDSDFLGLLTSIRRNEFNEGELRKLSKRKVVGADKPLENIPRLFSRNVAVDVMNDRVLDKISGEQYVFEMRSLGPDVIVASLKKGCI